MEIKTKGAWIIGSCAVFVDFVIDPNFPKKKALATDQEGSGALNEHSVNVW